MIIDDYDHCLMYYVILTITLSSSCYTISKKRSKTFKKTFQNFRKNVPKRSKNSLKTFLIRFKLFISEVYIYRSSPWKYSRPSNTYRISLCLSKNPRDSYMVLL